MQGQAPQDPALQVTQMNADIQNKALQQRDQSDQRKQQVEMAKLQQRVQELERKEQADMAREQLVQDREDSRKKAEIDARVYMNTQDNETAKELTAVEVASGERTNLTTGTGINPNP